MHLCKLSPYFSPARLETGPVLSGASSVLCGSWDDEQTTLPKEKSLQTIISGSAAENIICPWPYLVTEFCTINDQSGDCQGQHHSITCTKFKNVTLDGHDSDVTLYLDANEKVRCPVNYAIIAFCSSDSETSCHGNWGSITCAPIKFNECLNVDDVLNPNIELQYRMSPAQIKVWSGVFARNYEASVWSAENYQENVCALGDVISMGTENSSNKHVLIRGISETAVTTPKSTRKIVDFKDKYEIHELVPETGYICLGDVVIRKSDRKFDRKNFCCVRKDLTVIADENILGDYKFPVRDRHDTQGLVAGHFLSAKKNRQLRLLRVDNINVQASFDMRGPKERPLKLQESSANLVWTLDMSDESKKRHNKNEGFSVWRADMTADKFHRFGDILANGIEKPSFHFLLKSDDRRAFMPPTTFVESWSSFTNFLKNENVTVWQARCPSNYHAIGDLITVNNQDNEPVEPKTSDCSCIHTDHITNNQADGQIMKTFSHTAKGDRNILDYEQSSFIKKASIQYIAEKPVSKSRMVEVKYDMTSKEVNPDNIKGLRKGTVINRSYFPQCATRSYEFTLGESSSYSVNLDFSFGASLDVGMPPRTSSQMSFSFSSEKSDEETSETTSSVDATLEMPEESQLSVTILEREHKEKIPYRSIVEKTFVDGSKGYFAIKGVYNSVSVTEIVVEFSEIENLSGKSLSGDSRYEDSPGLIYKKGEHTKTWFNLGSDDQYVPPDRKQPIGIWGASKTIEDSFCSMGDVAVQGYDYPEVEHYLAYAIAPGALVKPIGFFEEFDDTGSGVDTPVTFYDMLAPCGYTCIGSVAVTSRTERPDLNKYCCVNNEYLTKGNNQFVWNNKGNSALREASIWWNAAQDDSGIYQAHFMAVTGHGAPYTWLAYVLNKNRVKPYIHYMFGDWEGFSKCSADCGWGTKHRTRVCQQVNLRTMQTLRTDLDAQICIDANLGQNERETAFCKIKDCSPCAHGDSGAGIFKYEMIRGTTIVNDENLPYNKFYR